MEINQKTPDAGKPVEATDEPIYSRRQPAWHMATMSIFTLGTYNVYWLYKNLTTLNQEPPEGTGEHFCLKHPVFSTALFFIPVVNLIIGMQFFALVGEIGPEAESFWRKNAGFVAFLISLAYGGLLLLGLLKEPYHLFYLASCLPLALTQHGLNQYFERLEKSRKQELLVRAAFNPIELVIIVLGASLLGLCAVGPSVIPPGYK